MAELMGMNVTDPGPFGHPFDVAMDGASVERLAVITLDEAS